MLIHEDGYKWLRIIMEMKMTLCDIVIFAGGFISGGTIGSLLTLKFTKKTKHTQNNNYVSGDMAGRDNKKG